MGKVFGMLLIIGGVWLGLELYQHGPGGAFGGSLATILGADPVEAEEHASKPRYGGSVDRAHRDSEDRFDRMLGE
ncbi:MAG: hypothetical protein QNK05_13545 [Myxococcota bacterium]|nr:hypothetical protein [Myxococcota bacterium]